MIRGLAEEKVVAIARQAERELHSRDCQVA